MWYWHKNWHIGQWNRIETPEINRTPGVSQSLARGGKTMQWENAVSSASSIGKAGQPHVNQWSFNTPSHHTQEETQNVLRHDTITFLDDTARTFSDINCTIVFLGQFPKAIETKAKINKWDLIKLRSFCTVKETINTETTRAGEKHLQTRWPTQA